MFFRSITEISPLILTIFYVIFEITEIPSAIYFINNSIYKGFVATPPEMPAPECSTTDASTRFPVANLIFSIMSSPTYGDEPT